MRGGWMLVAAGVFLQARGVHGQELAPRNATDQAPAPAYQQSLGPYQRPAATDTAERTERPAWELAAPPSRHRHDGLYLRLAGGIGTGFDSSEGTGQLSRAGVAASGASGSVSGLTGATEIALGASPIAGLAMGGGIYTATITSPESDDVEFGGATGAGMRYGFTVTQLAMFAAFADVYPWPTQGFHVQGGAGLGTLVMGLGQPVAEGSAPTPILESHTGAGFGFMLGAGYEWWVSDEWSVGGLARLLYAWTSGSDRVGVAWSHQTGAVTLLLTATYH
jgi:hypothetical protein